MQGLPSLFVSHGAPSFALEPGVIGSKLQDLGRRLPPLRAVVIVSPHWITPAIRVTASLRPQTIHDFKGFDPALNDIHYRPPGDAELADRVVRLLKDAGWSAGIDPDRGLDHGAWVPLLYLLPEARVPVLQVSLPVNLDSEGAWALGRDLSPLANDGILVVGSGSLTHNLQDVFQGADDVTYAEEFARWIRDAVEAGQFERLKSALANAPHADRAHPTPEHFWPLLVAAGAAPGRSAAVLEGGMSHEVLSMDAFVFGVEPD